MESMRSKDTWSSTMWEGLESEYGEWNKCVWIWIQVVLSRDQHIPGSGIFRDNTGKRFSKFVNSWTYSWTPLLELARSNGMGHASLTPLDSPPTPLRCQCHPPPTPPVLLLQPIQEKYFWEASPNTLMKTKSTSIL